jgi:hypothetical protein
MRQHAVRGHSLQNADKGETRMADNGVQAREGTEARTENTPSPAEDKNTPSPAEEKTPEAAAEAMAPGSDQSTIRSIFVARATASSAEVGFSQMATADQGLAVRGAYLAHLSAVDETVAGGTVADGDVLRRAYVVAHTVTAAALPSRPKRAAARPAKRGRKPAAPKPKRRTAGAAAPKAKKRGRPAAKAKPGKRRGR